MSVEKFITLSLFKVLSLYGNLNDDEEDDFHHSSCVEGFEICEFFKNNEQRKAVYLTFLSAKK